MDRLEIASRRAEDDPDDPGVWLEMASALLDVGAVDPARHVIERARSCSPATAQHWCALGGLHLRLEERDTALEALRAATVLDPAHVESVRRFARTALDMGAPKEAEEVVRKSLELSSEPGLRPLLALALEARGELDEALAQVEAALEADGRSDESHLLLAARLARRLERDEVEERVLKELSWLQPGDPRVAIRWARIQIRKDRLDLAHAELVRVSRQRGLTPDDREDLGVLFSELDDVESALVQLQMAVEAAPGRSSARIGWGDCLERDGQLEAAARAYASALETDPELTGVHWRRGRVLARLGRHREAVEPLIRASGERPDDEEIRTQLAESLLASGRVTTAGSGGAGLSGDLSVFRLEEIIEFLGVQRATGQLHITSTNREATIDLVDGRILDVRHPEQLDAEPPRSRVERRARVESGIQVLLTWSDGQVRFQKKPKPELDWPGFEHQLVLMSVMKSIDESDR